MQFLGRGLAAVGLVLLLGACETAPAGPSRVLTRLADSARRAGDYETAVLLYQQAANEAPEAAEPRVQLGEALLDSGRANAAAEKFRDALRLDPDHGPALRGYGKVLIGLGLPASAVVQFEKAVDIDPGDVHAYTGLGVALDLTGDHEAAQATYRKALQIAPESLTARNNLGLSLAVAGQFDEAIRLLHEVVSRPEATARHRQNLALAYGLAGRMEAAKEIGRIDLDEEALMNNLAYFELLHAMRGEGAASPTGEVEKKALDAPEDTGPAPPGIAVPPEEERFPPES